MKLAKGQGTEAAGIAMHVLADTWAHTYFAGTPSLVINNTNWYFYELFPVDGAEPERKQIVFSHNPSASEDVDKPVYVGSVYQSNEHSIMNLGHGRAGHLPDYSYIRYVYLPAWGGYKEIIKDNPHDYEHAFAQMVYALSYLKGDIDVFEKQTYAFDKIQPHREKIRGIFAKRQVDASADWKAFGESLSGEVIPDFDMDKYIHEYVQSQDKSDTYLGRFFNGALSQKKMVTKKIMESGNRLAGI